MKINWLWDSRIGERKVKGILKDANHPKFNIYAEKLFSRVNNPKMAFGIVDRVTFCRKWSSIKKRMRKDRWLKDRVIFWQTIYERLHEKMEEEGFKIRVPQEMKIPRERMRLSQEIRGIRIKLGCTQRDIAKRLGVIQQYISKIESGHENVSVDTLTRIADVFNKRLVIELK
jgi:DNA-binding XRE family transcriptional regulator